MKLRVFRLLAIAGLISRFLGSVQILAQNAYITNDGSGNVSVIDTATNKVIATITVGSAPEGVAVSPGRQHSLCRESAHQQCVGDRYGDE